jgi:beta-galactosidase/beta-glucuronidase
MSAPAYPRPQVSRTRWQSLDGRWDYSFFEAANPSAISWHGDIRVPYPPESTLSGVGDESFHQVIWYRKTFELPAEWDGERIHLHFGAVDYRARVWVNDRFAIEHEGGHTPFSVDITDLLASGEQTLIVRAEDDPHDMAMPRGKQDWEEQPHHIWYPRTTGIWQSVWLEPLSPAHIQRVRFTPDLARFGIETEVHVSEASEDLRLELVFKLGDRVLAADTWNLGGREAKRFFHLVDPGIYRARQEYQWSPEQPTLIDVELKLWHDETLLDEVNSYTALRTVEVRDGRFQLNGRPYFLRLALDQGYWDESLLAAPNDEALSKDVELAKAMGFNGVRKHQKVEDPRYLYWADRLGLLVWEEMPSAYAFTPKAVERVTREWLEVIDRDYNHPCIVAWVCFNESWGVPDLPVSEAQRHFVSGLYHLTKTLDSSRPVVGNDGWEHIETDLLTIHDYSREAAKLGERYGTVESSSATSKLVLEHGRAILLGNVVAEDRPVILSEFGGIRFHPQSEGWGYQQAQSSEDLLATYSDMIAAVSGTGLAGFCYTQFADTFQEQNGLLYSDRRPKVALESLAKATSGGG